jgi:hypothetical protein
MWKDGAHGGVVGARPGAGWTECELDGVVVVGVMSLQVFAMVVLGSTSSEEDPMHQPIRSLHLIDVENLVGGSRVGVDAVAPAFEAYRRTVTVGPEDHVVLGTGTELAFASKAAWPGALLRIGKGIDGADRALLSALAPDFIASHYHRLVVGSGDHAFAPMVAELRSRRVAVMVIVRDRTSLSGDLRRLAMHRCLAVAS